MKKIYILFANKLFRDEELKIPLDYFKKKGIDLIKVSDKKEKAIGKLGMEIFPDITYNEIIETEACGIILVGGPGTKVFFENTVIYNLLNKFNNQGKIIASICISPVVLAKAGILKGKKATVWIDGKEELIKNGAIYLNHDVVVDNNIITANGPKVALQFAKTVYESIKDIIYPSYHQ